MTEPEEDIELPASLRGVVDELRGDRIDPSRLARAAVRLGPLLDAPPPAAAAPAGAIAKWAILGGAALAIAGIATIALLSGRAPAEPPPEPRAAAPVATRSPAPVEATPLESARAVEIAQPTEDLARDRAARGRAVPAGSGREPHAEAEGEEQGGREAEAEAEAEAETETEGAAVVGGGPALEPATELEEHRILARARAALASSPQVALAGVEDHARRFPEGSFVEEREFLRVRALAALDRGASAREAASRFAARFPRSPYVREVARIAGSIAE
jgi:hypothetical protein